ncbi:MAG: NAD-dependent epimerase/dehydratase family protein [Chloroflexi bacterium]|nr:MAG: NAD-dependent epimerase/dehydratase family protein [Chloroflexota bacterium]
MKFLVTGGAGFLGAALAHPLAHDGHEVRALDDLSAGDSGRLAAEVLFTRGDVNDRPKLWSLLQGVECVYHLAARVSVPESILFPREYNAVNVGGTVGVMEAMRDAGVKRVVLTSSGAVYGAQVLQPLRETLVPNPDSPYAVSKLSAEAYVRTIGALWGIETVALRVFNAYGPGQPLPASHPPVVPRFIKGAVSGASLVVHGDGQQSRDYVFVSDVVAALLAAATARNLDQLVINVGSGKATTLRQLVAEVAEVTGTRLEPLYNNNESGGVREMCADLTLAGDLLAYSPKVGLNEGLRRTVAADERFRT